MGVWLMLEGAAPARCTGYHHHVHTEITRARGRADPRVAGRSRHKPMQVTKRLDHLSPTLFLHCAQGRPLPTLTLEIRRPPSDLPEDAPPPERLEETPWFRFELHEVFVTSVVTSMEDGPLETLTLDYARVTWTFEGEDQPHAATWHVHS